MILAPVLFNCCGCNKHEQVRSSKDSLAGERRYDSLQRAEQRAEDSIYRLDTFALGERVVYLKDGSHDYHRATCKVFPADSLRVYGNLNKKTTIAGARYRGLTECRLCTPDSANRERDEHWKIDDPDAEEDDN